MARIHGHSAASKPLPLRTGVERARTPAAGGSAIGYDTCRAEADLGWRSRSYLDGLRETFAREAASA
jgi:hypothetical protein